MSADKQIPVGSKVTNVTGQDTNDTFQPQCHSIIGVNPQSPRRRMEMASTIQFFFYLTLILLHSLHSVSPCFSPCLPFPSLSLPFPCLGFEREYTAAEVAQHNKDDDCWMTIHGKVYDCTGFLVDHPGKKRGRQAKAATMREKSSHS